MICDAAEFPLSGSRSGSLSSTARGLVGGLLKGHGLGRTFEVQGGPWFPQEALMSLSGEGQPRADEGWQEDEDTGPRMRLINERMLPQGAAPKIVHTECRLVCSSRGPARKTPAAVQVVCWVSADTRSTRRRPGESRVKISWHLDVASSYHVNSSQSWPDGGSLM